MPYRRRRHCARRRPAPDVPDRRGCPGQPAADPGHRRHARPHPRDARVRDGAARTWVATGASSARTRTAGWISGRWARPCSSAGCRRVLLEGGPTWRVHSCARAGR
jgi:hypothetical protein